VTATRPHVVVHVAVSLDGRTAGFEADVGRYYDLARAWDEDVTLTGADTILAQRDALAHASRPGPAPDGPLLAVVDGQGRVEEWATLRECGRWSDVLALRASGSRQDGRRVRQLVTRGRRVNLPAALRALREREGASLVRVDSGGALTGALLRRGLVDELSFLIHPRVSGSGTAWHGPVPAPAIELSSLDVEAPGNGLIWLRYAVRR
jgi:2,5-diamino-6-(ribosylamino)-4(3H)-pyrimidinone 5'-phosphate reductase